MKKLIPLMLFIFLMLSGTYVYANNSQNMTDAQENSNLFDIQASDWCYPYIETLAEKGGVSGYKDGTFKPDNMITNAEFVKMIVGMVTGEHFEGNVHWADGYIQKARELGIVENDELPESEFDEAIRRQRVAKFTARTMNKVLKEEATPDAVKFIMYINDWVDVCDVCKPYVLEVYSKGVMTCLPNGTFSGRENTTRAEAALFIIRMINTELRV